MSWLDDAYGQANNWLGDYVNWYDRNLGPFVGLHNLTQMQQSDQDVQALKAQGVPWTDQRQLEARMRNPLAMMIMPANIKAYHGSPHTFDQFDASKIGTGEGAQAYGHGLYFAENPGTAKAYQDALKGRGGLAGDGSGNLTPEFAALNKRYDELKAVANPTEAQLKEQERLLAEILDIQKGHMYEVTIRANPEDFLQWDKPLSEQSANVQAVLKRALPPTAWSGVSRADAEGGQIIGILQRLAASERLPNGSVVGAQDAAARVSEALRSAGASDPWMPGGARGTSAAGGTGESIPQFSSGASGIPGIRYLDQGSRGAGEGTHNYVVFNPDIVDIRGNMDFCRL